MTISSTRMNNLLLKCKFPRYKYYIIYNTHNVFC